MGGGCVWIEFQIPAVPDPIVHTCVNMAFEVKAWKQLAVDYKVYDPVMVGSIDGTDSIPHDRAIYRARDTKCK